MSSHLKTWYTPKPLTIAIAKNRTALRMIIQTLVLVSFALKTNVRTMMPMTSSMIAELTMVVPTVPFSLPSSLRAATVMLTEVADIIVPMKSALKNCSLPNVSKP